MLLFVTLSGRVEAPARPSSAASSCAGSVAMSLTVCPDYVVSGVLAQGILPFAVIAGFFGMLCPVLLFGMGSPHLSAGLPLSWPPRNSPPACSSPRSSSASRSASSSGWASPSSSPAYAWHRSPPGRRPGGTSRRRGTSRQLVTPSQAARAHQERATARRVRSQGRYKASPQRWGARKKEALCHFQKGSFGRSHRRQPMRGRL